MEKTLWLMVGIPGSGKSYIAKNKFITDDSWCYISRDEIRYKVLAEDEEYFAHEEEVFDIFTYKIESAFRDLDCYNVIADATHITWASRHKLLRELHQMTTPTWDIVPVVVTAPLEEILKNNAERNGRAVVPNNVIRRMASQMTDPKTDPYHYAGIFYINNKRENSYDLFNK